MITSFSRLFRQIFGGAKAHPVQGAPTGAVGAVTEAQEAAQHRENLKRAMEVAFATPTAEADEPPEVAPLAAEPELTLVEAMVETEPKPLQAVEPVAAAEPEEEEDLDEDDDDDDDDYDDEEEARASVAEAATLAAPLVAEALPAIELAETEEHTALREEALAPDADDAAEDAEPVAESFAAEEAVEAAEDLVPVSEAMEDPIAVEDTLAGEPIAEAEQPVEAAAAADDELMEEPVADMEAAPVEELTAEAPAADDVEVTPEAVAEGLAAVATKAKRAAKKKAPAKKKAATKKRAPKKGGALADDAVWLSDAVAYSLKGEWTNLWTPPEDASGAERLEALREKAAAGELTVWGRTGESEDWQAIKPAYWKTSYVDPLSFLMGRENTATEPKPTKGKKPGLKYTALKVSQSAVEELWPASEAQVRDAA